MKRGLMTAVSFTKQNTLGGGDIRRQDMPFLSNQMDFFRVGAMVMHPVPKLQPLAFQLALAHTFDGRNVGEIDHIHGRPSVRSTGGPLHEHAAYVCWLADRRRAGADADEHRSDGAVDGRRRRRLADDRAVVGRRNSRSRRLRKPARFDYQAELTAIKNAQSRLTAAQRKAIDYWGSGGVLRWNEILLGLVARFNLPPVPNADNSYPVPDANNPFCGSAVPVRQSAVRGARLQLRHRRAVRRAEGGVVAQVSLQPSVRRGGLTAASRRWCRRTRPAGVSVRRRGDVRRQPPSC